MAIILAVVLGVAALAFVLAPLFARSVTNEMTEEVVLKPAEGASEREQGARTALQEVELDYQLGNISEIDYNALRERYMRRALVALKTRYDREQELDDVIEEQLQKMKDAHGSNETA